MMNDLVKNVFLVIMGVIAAVVLYILLFGSLNFQGQRIEAPEQAGYEDTLDYWKGALWYAAEMMESPIARYYYMYCYIPNMHANDYVDENLGGSKNGWAQIRGTQPDLSSSGSDLYTFPDNGLPHWSTGWR